MYMPRESFSVAVLFVQFVVFSLVEAFKQDLLVVYFRHKAGTIPTERMMARAVKNFSAAFIAGEFSAIRMGQVRVKKATL